MKIKIVLFFLVVFTSACQTIKFDRYPSIAEAEYPTEIRGKYLYIHESNNKLDTDTIVVNKNAYRIIESGVTSVRILDSNNVFSIYKNHYFFFSKEESNWIGFEMKKKGNKLTVTPFINPANRTEQKNLKVLKKYFEDVKMIPGKNQFDNTTYSAKMKEENLLKYIKKYNRFSIKLIQVIE